MNKKLTIGIVIFSFASFCMNSNSNDTPIYVKIFANFGESAIVKVTPSTCPISYVQAHRESIYTVKKANLSIEEIVNNSEHRKSITKEEALLAIAIKNPIILLTLKSSAVPAVNCSVCKEMLTLSFIPRDKILSQAYWSISGHVLCDRCKNEHELDEFVERPFYFNRGTDPETGKKIGDWPKERTIYFDQHIGWFNNENGILTSNYQYLLRHEDIIPIIPEDPREKFNANIANLLKNHLEDYNALELSSNSLIDSMMLNNQRGWSDQLKTIYSNRSRYLACSDYSLHFKKVCKQKYNCEHSDSEDVFINSKLNDKVFYISNDRTDFNTPRYLFQSAILVINLAEEKIERIKTDLEDYINISIAEDDIYHIDVKNISEHLIEIEYYPHNYGLKIYIHSLSLN